MASSTTFLNQWTLMEPFNDINKVPMRVPVNVSQVQALIYMNKTVPIIKTTMTEFQNNLFSVPFELIMGSTLGGSDTSTLDSSLFNLKPEVRMALISKYWMPWLRTLDTMIVNFGFAPFYFKTIETTVAIDASDVEYDDSDSGDEAEDVDYAAAKPVKNQQLFKRVFFQFPVSPNMEMGKVETFIYEKEQFLIWKWGEYMGKELANTFDTKMYFIVEELPSLNGTINSRLSPLINDWLYMMDLKQKDMRLIDAMVNPRYAVEYSPNMGPTLPKGDQEYVEGMHPNSFFPNITVGQFTEHSGIHSAGDHVHNVLSSIQGFHNAALLNTGTGSMGHMNAGLDPQGTIFKSAGNASQYNTQMSESMDKMALFLARNPELADNVHLVPTKAENAFYLNPYEKLVTINGPTQTISDKITTLQEKFNAMVSMILNSPFGLDTAASSATSNSALVTTESSTSHNRIRHRIKFYCGVVKSVFKLAFRTLFERVDSDMQRLLRFHIQNNLSVDEILGLERALDFSVVFKPANMEMDFHQIVELYRNGVFTEDEAYNIYFSKIGYTDPPLKAPTAFKQQMKLLYRQSPEEGNNKPAPPAEAPNNNKKKKREEEEESAGEEEETPIRKKAKKD